MSTTQLAEFCKSWKAHPQHASVKIETDAELEVARAEEGSYGDTEMRAIARAKLEEADEAEKDEGGAAGRCGRGRCGERR